MGLFSRNKEKRTTFYMIHEVTEKKTFSQKYDVRFDAPIFEDKKLAQQFCKEQKKQSGMIAVPFPYKFSDKDIQDYKEQGCIIIFKKEKV